MWYAIAATVLALVGGMIWAVVRSGKSGEARAERDQLKENRKRRGRGDEVMAEPVADEGDWLANARERLARMRRDGKLP